MEENVNIFEWVFITKSEIPKDIVDILAPGEVAVASYKTLRDSATFTDKRIIVKDVQGLTGKKVEMYSIPYSSINMWSTETAGLLFDLSAEVQLWTRQGNIKITLKKDVDIREFDRLIAHCILR
ncbi:PH domain-containing protein [Terrisporobacter sp.]